MLKAFRVVFWGLLAVALIAIASANRTPVELRLLPEEMSAFFGGGQVLQVPLFLVIFAAVLAGLLIGLVWEWLRAAGVRAEASQHKRQVGHLEREVSRLRGAKGEDTDEIVALLENKAK